MLKLARENILLLFVSSLYTFKPILAQDKINIGWSVIEHLPRLSELNENPGVAGAFSGIHNNALIIAGGANFPETLPWNGGKKVYHDEIYILAKSSVDDFKWINTGYFKLSEEIAYGASISTPVGVLCIGGENERKILRSVFLLQWNVVEKNIHIKQYPELPIPLANSSATIDKNVVYIVGGETTTGVSDKFYSLDLNNVSAGWKLLPPLPKSLSHGVAVVQSNGTNKSVYIFGGRRKKADGISDLYDSVFEFDILSSKWSSKKPLPYALSAGTGIAIDSNQILLFGGDKGETFHKTELLLSAIASKKSKRKKERLLEQKNKLQRTHPGFCNEILLFNTFKNEWSIVGRIPFPIPVTTTAVKWDNRVIIPSGEIKAGVRTSNVLMGEFNNIIK